MKPENEVCDLLIALLRSAVSDYTAAELPFDPELFESAYLLAKSHSVEAVAYYGVVRNNIVLSPELQNKWRSRQDVNIIKSVVEDSERDSIFALFSKNGISFLPLKGILIKQMYPSPEYRQMADMDILIREEQMERATELLTDNGYQCTRSGIGHHDSFFKPPYVAIELHHEMIPVKHPLYHSYYENIWGKAIPVTGCEYHLDWNDFYIYMLVHFAKHYYGSGSGIRSVMDIYVFLQKHRDDLDETYLNTELEKLKLKDFRREAEDLAAVWFEGAEPAVESEMAGYVLESGVYGIREHVLEKRIKDSYDDGKLNRLSYIRKRLFPNRNFMAYYYPVLEKKPYLLPWFWMKRIAKKWKNGVREFRYVNSMEHRRQ